MSTPESFRQMMRINLSRANSGSTFAGCFTQKAFSRLPIKSLNFQYLPANDCLLQPIFFLYRHHIELQLKVVLTLSSTYTPKPAHSLDKLWNEVKNQFPRWNTYFESSTNNAFEALLEDLNHLDPTSFVARYPDEIRTGKEVFVDEWQRFIPSEWADIRNVRRYLFIDLKHLKVEVNKMSKFLDGLYEALP